jgi:hypothetical protein
MDQQQTHKVTAKIRIEGFVALTDAKLKVVVQDTSLQDVAAETIFTFDYPPFSHTPGQTHDIAPSIEFPADIDRRQTWTWAGQITDATGRLIYLTMESYPIDFAKEDSEIEVVLRQVRTCGNE